MRERIYREFTCERGIMLSSEVLEYLEENIKDEVMLKAISSEYKRRNGQRLADICSIREVAESFNIKKDAYNILNQEFKEKNELLKYRNLLSRIERMVQPIYLLGEEYATIFGCYYKDRNGREVLEDEGDVIPLDMRKCNGDVFLCDNVFVAIEGKKIGDKFVGFKTYLPSIEKKVRKVPNIDKKDLKILFFSDFQVNEINGRILGRILSKTAPDIVVLMGRLCPERSSFIPFTSFREGLRSASSQVEIPDIILCPDADDLYPSFLPKEIEIPEEHGKSIRAATNPFILETHGCSIGVIREDVFKYKEQGTFIGRNYVDSFVRTVLSQHSFNPFGISNLDIDGVPDVFIVGQDFYPFVTSVEDVVFVSCPSFKEEMSFVSYDTSSGDPVILSTKHLLK
ncbi:DNA polymerase alpha/epsilon-like protein [Encephalitozoon hellem ATCC 50504]|uniref:DNA polymerase epsilon subunit 2 n=1 Tax=Encephalitozoon hellem TaxID=27973 RepID=A0A9Q9C3Z4_ENCHE|nr:DNA polymerase alpha/epsilon-like protein [Encephalitozoon hellem ATCC 50504]AFM98248.1 DNA polymerase alpha/epsilon-like protein [Encephalitozoon hellem ATCC 50504]UTX43125.1 DNA polymerase epsilon subunit 2 [Encephalitozoon hellem]|eukprot:XP_003887229.1 DNA polymerase alpha/epsilon-like protein [Encephalitozoon hellem ATCC 50504]